MKIREELQNNLKNAYDKQDAEALCVYKLIDTAINDQDLMAQKKGYFEGISDTDIHALLLDMLNREEENMVKSRPYSARQRVQLIKQLMPHLLNEEEERQAIHVVINELKAEGLKSMDKVMQRLRQDYGKRMNFLRVSSYLRETLQ